MLVACEQALAGLWLLLLRGGWGGGCCRRNRSRRHAGGCRASGSPWPSPCSARLRRPRRGHHPPGRHVPRHGRRRAAVPGRAGARVQDLLRGLRRPGAAAQVTGLPAPGMRPLPAPDGRGGAGLPQLPLLPPRDAADRPGRRAAAGRQGGAGAAGPPPGTHGGAALPRCHPGGLGRGPARPLRRRLAPVLGLPGRHPAGGARRRRGGGGSGCVAGRPPGGDAALPPGQPGLGALLQPAGEALAAAGRRRGLAGPPALPVGPPGAGLLQLAAAGHLPPAGGAPPPGHRPGQPGALQPPPRPRLQPLPVPVARRPPPALVSRLASCPPS